MYVHLVLVLIHGDPKGLSSLVKMVKFPPGKTFYKKISSLFRAIFGTMAYAI